MSYARPQIHRTDKNHRELVAAWEAMGGLWVPYANKPFDGWAWHRRWGSYWPVEIKDPKREGHANEYTERQRRVMKKLRDAGAVWIVWRTVEDVKATYEAIQL